MQFDFTLSTDKDVAAAAAAVEQALAERKFSVLWALDMQAKLAEKGFKTDTQFRVLEVCNAARAKAALETNPMVGYFLPCKVVVYREPGARTRIGLVKPTALIGLIDDPQLAELAREVEATLVEAVEAAHQPLLDERRPDAQGAAGDDADL